MSHRNRSTRSFRRRKPSKVPNQAVLIVCEGAKTEPSYFEKLRDRLGLKEKWVEVEIEGDVTGSAPISVVDYAIKSQKQRQKEARRSTAVIEYDEVWCVFDVEAPQPHASLKQACDKAKRKGLSLAMSNPCFEYWYLLHFEKTCKLFHGNEDVYKQLKAHLGSYQKSDASVFEVLFPRIQAAIRHAAQILNEQNCQDDIANHNSSTDVHLLVEYLYGLQSES